MSNDVGKISPLVSVIVPVYNVEKYLSRCLDSILDQTFSDYEVVCINDCSSDNSQSILEQYKEKYPDKFSLFKNEENIGIGRTRERGIECSRGKWILFIDSDDYVCRDYIATYVNAVEDGEYDVAAGGYIRDIDGKYKMHNIFYGEWTMITYPNTWAKIFRKQFLVDNQMKFSDIRCGEDIFFSLQLFYHGARHRNIDYTGYYYCLNRNSITGTMKHDRKYEQSVAEIFGVFLKRFNIADLPEKKQRIIEYAYLANMINALITYGHGCGIRKMSEKYLFFIHDLKKKFPDYKANPYYGIRKQKHQLIMVRIGVGITMLLHKMKLDKFMFYVVSLL